MNNEVENNKINVLMITGVYLPEINGAVIQCNQLMNKLKKEVSFSVLTNTFDKLIKYNDCIDEILISRVFVPRFKNIYNKFYIIKFIFRFINMLKIADIIHIHGFSKRNSIIILMGLLYRKKIILKMTSYGQDDPLTVKNKSFIMWEIYKKCHSYIGISPAFYLSSLKTKLLINKYNSIPNGVDLYKFYKASSIDKNKLKEKYGFSNNEKIIIFVGHFSHEKNPFFLYESWIKLIEKNIYAQLLFIGNTKDNLEVDKEIANLIKNDAIKRGIFELIHFVEKTIHVDEYMKIADVFVLPSLREGLPNVLLEAMASELPCIVNNLSGITDWLIEDYVTGFLFKSKKPEELAAKIEYCLRSVDEGIKIGIEARKFIENNFSINVTSQRVLALYNKLILETSYK
jgi:glycosyltransferase involved in cell wall biosynthesis